MLNIAICEDDKDMLKFISDTICDEFQIRNIEFKSYLYDNASDLISEFETTSFEALFLDIFLPDMTGFEIAEYFQSLKQNVYIIFVTSNEEVVHKSFRYRPINYKRYKTGPCELTWRFCAGRGMVINMRINSANIRQSNNARNSNVIKWNKVDNKHGLINDDNFKRNFDIFINNGSDNKKVDSKTRKLIENIESAENYTVHDMAVESYLDMQSMIAGAISVEQQNQELFNTYPEEQAYLMDILDSTDGDQIIINDPKYCYSECDGPVNTYRQSVEEQLQRSIQNYENLLNPPEKSEEENIIMQKMYNIFASRFADATGKVSDVLDGFSDDSLRLNQPRTKENFIEESNKRIELLKKRSEGLGNLMKEYMSERENISEDNDFSDRKKTYALKEIHSLLSSFGILGLDFSI